MKSAVDFLVPRFLPPDLPFGLVITPQDQEGCLKIFDVCILLLQKGMFKEMEEQKGIHGNIWETA